ncbi:MAG TPA: spore coat biosynthesis protein F [Candidatus Latescibacteria bacterium]|nr:spore coat biosynthesis protein F [Candidatus Handelsmanbacteria bacterium]HIL08983.1 spore coat biosynthesis protein F [Candidatus Latescibacterota bacterium]
MRTVGVIEARMGSSRCPGKVLAEVVGKPLLELIVERLRRSARIDEVVIATSVEEQDTAIEDLAGRLQVPCYRGSEQDVRLRVLEAVRSVGGELIVQIGADQPFPDWELNDRLVDIYLEGEYDYVANALALSYPLGVVAQVYSELTLAETEALTKGRDDRDGTSDYIWQHPERYRLFNLQAPPELTAPEVRLTVDYPEDLQLIELIYEQLYPQDPSFTVGDILQLLERRPEWRQINGHLVHNNRIVWQADSPPGEE